MTWRIIFFVFLVCTAGIVFYLVQSNRNRADRVRRVTEPEPAESVPASPDPESLASNELVRIQEWIERNPGEYDEAVKRLEELGCKYEDAECGKNAVALAGSLRDAKENALSKEISELKLNVRELEEKGDFEEAVALIEGYSGPFREESLEVRNAEAERLRKLAEESRSKEKDALLRSALSILLKEGIKQTSAFIEENEAQKSSADKNQAWSQLADALQRAARLGDTVLESFMQQKGETVSVELKGGRRNLRIAGADKGAILYYTKVGSVQVTKRIPLSQLSQRELTLRVGEDILGLNLYRLASFANKSDYESAKLFADEMPSPLRERIVEGIEESASAGATNAAWKRLVSALFRAGVKANGIEDEPAALLEALKSSERSAGMNLLLSAVAKDLVRQYRDSEWIKDKGVVRLINFMYELKPDEDTLARQDQNETGENAEAIAGKDAKSIDWRKEMNF